MRPSMLAIARAVLPHFGMGDEELPMMVGKDRHASLAAARQVLFWVARQRLHMSYPELGREVGQRDHTSVMNAVQRVDAFLKGQAVTAWQKHVADAALAVLAAYDETVDRTRPGVSYTTGIELDPEREVLSA